MHITLNDASLVASSTRILVPVQHVGQLVSRLCAATETNDALCRTAEQTSEPVTRHPLQSAVLCVAIRHTQSTSEEGQFVFRHNRCIRCFVCFWD